MTSSKDLVVGHYSFVITHASPDLWRELKKASIDGRLKFEMDKSMLSPKFKTIKKKINRRKK